MDPAGLLSPEGCSLIGMVHLLPLPGSARWRGRMGDVLDAARRDADALVSGGCDAIVIENMGDVPYLKGHVLPETTAAMAVAVHDITTRHQEVPIGVQVLAAANREALGVAVAAGAAFVRVEGFAYAHVADEGWIDACAGELCRARAALGSDTLIWADVQKKHAAHNVTADLSLGELAEGAAFMGADALIVTGTATGQPTSVEDVVAASRAGKPVFVGSGVTPDNAPGLAAVAHGLIVGSWLKEDGQWRRPVDVARVRALRRALPS